MLFWGGFCVARLALPVSQSDIKVSMVAVRSDHHSDMQLLRLWP